MLSLVYTLLLDHSLLGNVIPVSRLVEIWLGTLAILVHLHECLQSIDLPLLGTRDHPRQSIPEILLSTKTPTKISARDVLTFCIACRGGNGAPTKCDLVLFGVSRYICPR
jgi:hypothetical protein